MLIFIRKKKLQRLVDERIDRFLQEEPADLAGVTYEPLPENLLIVTAHEK